MQRSVIRDRPRQTEKLAPDFAEFTTGAGRRPAPVAPSVLQKAIVAASKRLHISLPLLRNIKEFRIFSILMRPRGNSSRAYGAYEGL
jgi:hypothetical protein